MQGQVDAIEHMVAKGGDNIESDSGEEDKKPETDETLGRLNTLELGEDNLSPVEELHISHILSIDL